MADSRKLVPPTDVSKLIAADQCGPIIIDDPRVLKELVSIARGVPLDAIEIISKDGAVLA